ncbi:hypothetical protein NG895_30025 [Aeoliella sp. ICT_H6.2]|uniref:DUF3108 domain-containing protein n=1 Tax=Aeoliella straminimaris TaxID=2954799 RepID=A0A9X2FIS2_9BACT|nr:hypothetical protein [Aeoliella straminimaris]MCO6048154.1 hypothetical protein [Aeoliella straminimaris]
MRRTAIFFLVSLCLAVPAQGEDALGHAAEFYPLTTGSKWTMILDGPRGKMEMTNSVAGTDEVNGKQLYRLSSSVNGSVVATEHLQLSESGLSRNQFNGTPISPKIMLLPEPVKLGWKWEKKDVKLGEETMDATAEIANKTEKVAVPAGQFDAIRLTVTAKTKSGDVVSHYWLAKGVGIVKQDMIIGNVKLTLSLAEYEIAKQGRASEGDPKEEAREEAPASP